jgi:hypothetical protein
LLHVFKKDLIKDDTYVSYVTSGTCHTVIKKQKMPKMLNKLIKQFLNGDLVDSETFLGKIRQDFCRFVLVLACATGTYSKKIILLQ